MPCKVTLVPKKPRLKRADQFNSIESRIKRMESLLQSSDVANSLPQRSEISCSETIKEQTSPPGIDDLSNLMIGDTGAQKYIGPSSGFALLSPQGLSWVQEKTGSKQLTEILNKLKHHAHFWPQFNAARWWPGSNFIRHMLPSRDVAQQLVDNYFTNFNAVFPLFDRKTFATHLERQYSNDPPTSKSWYAALNIVLSIGCVTATGSVRLDPVGEGPWSRENCMELSWRFFQNASSVLTDLLILQNELMGVQTLVGMVNLSSPPLRHSLTSLKAFVMQAVLDPEAAFFLIAAAAHMGHGLGFHRWLGGFGLSQSELEQRRRVFWIIYVFEKSMSIRIGRPSAINDDDIGVPLPPEDLDDAESTGFHLPSSPGRKFYPFRAACTIALIESKVYSELYSARSWTRGPEERLNRVSRLDQELQEWKDSIPVEIRPEHTIQCKNEHRFAVIMLHFVYYNCVTTIHRVSVHHGSWTSKAGDPAHEATPSHSSPTSSTGTASNPRVYASYALCLSAARSTIHIATHFLCSDDDPRNSLIWIAVYFPLTACLTLFAHTLQAPLDPRVENDLELMERTLTSLCRPSNATLNAVARLVFEVFGDLVAIGRDHVTKAKAEDDTTALSSRNLLESISAPEKRSSKYPAHNEMESAIITPLTPPSDSNQSSLNTAPQSVDLSTGSMVDQPLPEFQSCHPFNFLPFDITDLDPTFMFDTEWSQLDSAGLMDPNEQFFGIG